MGKNEMNTMLQAAYPDEARSKNSSAEQLNVSNALSRDEKLGEQLAEKERQYSLWRAMVVHRRILLHCVAAFGAGMVFGYDTIANGATMSMPGFMLYFGAHTESGTLFIPSIWASLWTAMSNLLQAIGGFLISFVTDRLGRKWPCVGACIISIIGVGVQHGAQSREVLLIGKMVNGFAIGCVLATGTAWASEISPLRLRGPIQSTIVLFQFFMQAIGLVVVRLYVPNMGTSSFRSVFAIQWAPPVFTGILFCFVPESPSWLVLKGKIGAARNSLSRLHGPSNQIDARLAHLALGIHVEEEQARRNGAGSYFDLFRGSNLKRTLTIVWMFVGFGLTGACLLAQSIYFLIIAGLPAIHSYDVAIGGFGLAIVCIVFSWIFMEKTGRRSIFLIGAAGNCITMFIIGGLYYSDKKAALWAVAVIMNVLIAWQAVTLVSTSWAITGEISSYRLRGKSQAVAVISNAFSTWLFGFTVAYIYNVDAGNLGIRAGFVYGAGSLIFFVGSWVLVPDLRGVTTEEVDMIYAEGVKPWRIVDVAKSAKAGREAKGVGLGMEKSGNGSAVVMNDLRA